jgi:methionine-rich copper-binding protein CopC
MSVFSWEQHGRLTVLPFLLLSFAATPALAHNRLLDSKPMNGQVFAIAPTELILQFFAPTEPGFSHIELQSGRQWQPLPVSVQHNQLKAPLPKLASGQHSVRWSVMSRDGHRQNGILTFTVS